MTATTARASRTPSSPQPGQGVNYPRNRWHGVLTPIGEAQDFLVVDRGGDGTNLEECHLLARLTRSIFPRNRMMADVSLIDRLLDVIEHDIVPKTAEGVAHGNKLFGAAILRKDDRSLVLAETNNETENPLWHGEVHCLKRFYEMPKAERVDTKDCIFLATHEPCSLCLSAITWTGFDNFYYLFSHEDSRDSFAIPHDLKILKEVFTLDPGGYNAENAYWKSFRSAKLVRALPEAEREAAGSAIAVRKISFRALRRLVRRLSGEQGRKRHPAEIDA